MIHYHGGPITPVTASIALWKARHGFVSFARPDQIEIAASICQSFALDNGAFSHWSKGGSVDVEAYAQWVDQWRRHPAFDWALIPDEIDGSEEDNDKLLKQWPFSAEHSVPVWHLHESIDRLLLLALNYPRVALGSSGDYSRPGAPRWWQRMGEAMAAVCDESGRPQVKPAWTAHARPCDLHAAPAQLSRQHVNRPQHQTRWPLGFSCLHAAERRSPRAHPR